MSDTLDASVTTMAIKLTVAPDGTWTYTFDTPDEAAAFETARQRPPTETAGAKPRTRQPTPAEENDEALTGPALAAFQAILNAGDDGIINADLAQHLGIDVSSLPAVIASLRRQLADLNENFDQLVESDRPWISGRRPRRFTITAKGRKVAPELLPG